MHPMTQNWQAIKSPLASTVHAKSRSKREKEIWRVVLIQHSISYRNSRMIKSNEQHAIRKSWNKDKRSLSFITSRCMVQQTLKTSQASRKNAKVVSTRGIRPSKISRQTRDKTKESSRFLMRALNKRKTIRYHKQMRVLQNNRI